MTERLASGLEIVHADAVDARSLVAAVGSASGPSVVVLARTSEAALPEYRAVLAALVETVRVER
ncbi:hypothetical protein ACTU3I_12500 [Microbacterium sp. RD1]|uniref:hypothetical protein n=1 Tax=Microbacterium sp. RD1 TaxID=3457313 RepID=UPI003FA5D6BA